MGKEIDGITIELIISTEVPYGFDCGVCYFKGRSRKCMDRDCRIPTLEEKKMGIISKHWEVKKSKI